MDTFYGRSYHSNIAGYALVLRREPRWSNDTGSRDVCFEERAHQALL